MPGPKQSSFYSSCLCIFFGGLFYLFLWLDAFITYEPIYLHLPQSLTCRWSNLNSNSDHFPFFLSSMWQKETKNMECCWSDVKTHIHLCVIMYTIHMHAYLKFCFSFIKIKQNWRSTHQSSQTNYNFENYSTRDGHGSSPWHQALGPFFIVGDLPIPITHKCRSMLMTHGFITPAQTTQRSRFMQVSTWLLHLEVPQVPQSVQIPPPLTLRPTRLHPPLSRHSICPEIDSFDHRAFAHAGPLCNNILYYAYAPTP